MFVFNIDYWTTKRYRFSSLLSKHEERDRRWNPWQLCLIRLLYWEPFCTACALNVVWTMWDDCTAQTRTRLGSLWLLKWRRLRPCLSKKPNQLIMIFSSYSSGGLLSLECEVMGSLDESTFQIVFLPKNRLQDLCKSFYVCSSAILNRPFRR